MKVSDKLKDLGIELPLPAKPLAAYVPAVITGNLCFTSGQLPLINGTLLEMGGKGMVGSVVSKEDAKLAARVAALNALAAAAAKAGSVDAIKAVVKVTVFVASAEGFQEQPFVANGASLFFSEVFGEYGAHARSAVGVKELPLGTSVEVEAIFELN
ncbi:MAG: RidA family protein [Chloroherpetonaceae bacterium]|nr:RidA family protein [Chloroherpetonaceae bacterium]